MPKLMNLNAFMMFTPMMHGIGSWALPQNTIATEFTNPAFWQGIAGTLEQGCFDMVFFGDHMAAYDVYKGDAEPSIRYGLQFPVYDPVLLIPWMAAATEHLGYCVTMSTSVYPPYLLARKMSTLDHLTNGRIAWNVVTSTQENEARNLGLGTLPPKEERYARAGEFIDVCNELWDSWEPDALVYRVEDGVMVDTDKVHPVAHDGRFFSIHAASPVDRSPQTRPVVVQAGASPAGRDFAAKYAEVIFSIKRNAADMAAFTADMEQRAAKFGRSRSDFKIIFAIQVIQGDTHTEAVEKQRALVELAQVEPSLAKLSGITGADLSVYDVDAKIVDVPVPGAQGILDAFTRTDGPPLTLRQAAKEYGASAGSVQVVGTADEVTDQLEHLFVNGGGDGFNLTPPYLPAAYDEFVADVVPRLQKRKLFRASYGGSTTLRETLFSGNS